MSIDLNFIDEHTVLITYRGLLTYDDMSSTYTKVHDYAGTHDLRYILIQSIDMMYYSDALFDERLTTIRIETLSKPNFKAIIFIELMNQSLVQTTIKSYQKLHLEDKIYFVKDYSAAMDLIGLLDNPSSGSS